MDDKPFNPPPGTILGFSFCPQAHPWGQHISCAYPTRHGRHSNGGEQQRDIRIGIVYKDTTGPQPLNRRVDAMQTEIVALLGFVGERLDTFIDTVMQKQSVASTLPEVLKACAADAQAAYGTSLGITITSVIMGKLETSVAVMRKQMMAGKPTGRSRPPPKASNDSKVTPH